MYNSPDQISFHPAVAAPPACCPDQIEAMRRAEALRDEALRSRRLAGTIGCSRARGNLYAFARNNEALADLIDPLRSPYS